MGYVKKLWPLLTATHSYDKSISTRNKDRGTIIEAPILAYLIETTQGRILYDVGCDYEKIVNPDLRNTYYNVNGFNIPVPVMDEEQRIPNHLAKLGLNPGDVDVVFISHLHFDHAGGLCDVCGGEVHIQKDEMEAAKTVFHQGYFGDEIYGNYPWKIKEGEYDLLPGIRAISTPGHTAGHMSLWVEMPHGSPIVLCGDAADLEENIKDEIAPGFCWCDQENVALESILKLKRLALMEKAELWPNHDMKFWNSLHKYPKFHE